LILYKLSEPRKQSEIENEFKPAQRDDVKKSIRFLLDEEILYVTEDGKLSKIENKPKNGFRL
jgi:hypothetical protein